MTRQSGLILHPTSLPGPGGIGAIGEDARHFVDYLARAEQQIWQLLPLGPTDFGNSPYMSTSAFAGNPLLIDLRPLIEAGWLGAGSLEDAPQSGKVVDFEAVIAHRAKVLPMARAGFDAHAGKEEKNAFYAFCNDNASWLDDFALFSALRVVHQGLPWVKWPAPLRLRDPEALNQAREANADYIAQIRFEQYIFMKQWRALRAYANQRGVSIVGDIPIFVAANSADVWANPELFYLDHEGNPTVVAGVPPDYFSPTGQLWGNPLYRWDVLAEQKYRWWVERFRHTMKIVDLVRIDHFRGFAAYWEVPAGAKNAMGGKWIPGPGRALFDQIKAELGEIPVIAEDLGIITKEVTDLRDALDLPGMKVLHFAWDRTGANPHLPHNHVPNSVVYPGTHDNDTTVGWYKKLDKKLADQVRQYFAMDGHDIAWQMIGAAWSSVADLAITQTQDLLSLGSKSRMNTPGKAKGNWAWRLEYGQLDEGIVARLRHLTRLYGRSHQLELES